MSHPSHHLNLPDWAYAGKRAEHVPLRSRREEPPFTVIGCDSQRLDPISGVAVERDYKLVDGYLVPHYVTNKDRDRSNLQLLESRVDRFFEMAEEDIRFEVSYGHLEQELEQFDKTFAKINEKRAALGKPPFSITSNKNTWTQEERDFISNGAVIVGHTVTRLEKLGKILLEAERFKLSETYNSTMAKELCAEIRLMGMDDLAHDIDLLGNPTKDNLRRLMTRVAMEFKSLHNNITNEDHIMLVRCVLTRDGRVDHDGIFHHLIREIMKPTMAPMQHWLRTSVKELNRQLEGATDEDTKADLTKRIERVTREESGMQTQLNMARNNIVTEIGACLGAIDDMHSIMSVMTKHPMFAQFISVHNRRIQHGDERMGLSDMPLDKYQDTLDEYVELSRARACVLREDPENFGPLLRRWRFLGNELDAYHDTMMGFASGSKGRPIPTVVNTLELLDRGKNIIKEMAVLRLPRSHRSTTIYDTGMKPDDRPDDTHVREADRLSDKQKDDMSTVGRFRRKVWLLEHNQLRNQGVEI